MELEIDAWATAQSGANSYIESATTFESANVGTSAQNQPPAGTSAPEPETMTLYPSCPDNTAQFTAQNQAQTFAAQNDPATTDGPVDPSQGPPVDAYGFQAVGPDNNYNPFVTYDGTDLTSVVPQPFTPDAQCTVTDTPMLGYGIFTTVGEVHDARNSSAWFLFDLSGESSLTLGISTDGDHWSVDGSKTITDKINDSGAISTPLGSFSSTRVKADILWSEVHKHYTSCVGYPPHGKYYIWPVHMTRPVGGEPFEYGKTGGLNGVDDTSGNLKTVQINHPNYWLKVPAGSRIWLGVGNSVHFSLGASVFGVGLSSESTYSVDLQQWYEAGNRHDLTHDRWGRDGDIFHIKAKTYAHVFYCWTLGPP